MKRATPIAWYGAKTFLLHYLLEIVPTHSIYVEPFAGSAALFFAKKPAKIEVLNDVNSDLINFYRILRNPNTARQLRQQLELTPYSRAEFDQCKGEFGQVQDHIEKARQFYVLIEQSINCVFMGRWRRDRHRNRATIVHRHLDLIEQAVARLQNVQMESKDFENVLQHFDGADTLAYLDPPYVASTRTAPGMYQNETTDADHRRLLQWAKQAQSKVIISGYNNPVYDAEIGGWVRLDIPVACSSGNRKAKGNGPQPVSRRVESIWLNAAAVTETARALAARLVARQAG